MPHADVIIFSDLTFKCPGRITKWHVFCEDTGGSFYAGVWRRADDAKDTEYEDFAFTFVGSNIITVDNSGDSVGTN